METTVDITRTLECLVRPLLKLQQAGDPLAADDDLGELGLDSLASIELLGRIEDSFGIMIPDESLDENTFSSLDSLSRLVRSIVAA